MSAGALFTHEIENLKEAFPDMKASIEEDFEVFEQEAINKMGVLKNQPREYLGQ